MKEYGEEKHVVLFYAEPLLKQRKMTGTAYG